jgi:hypothetical protein
MALKDQQGRKEKQDPQVHKVRQAPMARKDRQGRKENPDHKAWQVPQVPMVHKDQQDRKVPQVRTVQESVFWVL